MDWTPFRIPTTAVLEMDGQLLPWLGWCARIDLQETKAHRNAQSKFLIGLHLQAYYDLPQKRSEDQVERCRIN